jgi:hypothetical protein
VSCFLTADGRAIHAIGGPVSAKRLLTEAQWAVDVYKRSRGFQDEKQVVEQAHLAKIGLTRSEFYQLAKRELKNARQEYDYNQRLAERSRRENPLAGPVTDVVSIETLARRLAASGRGYVSPAHSLFAAEPLVPFPQLRKRIFEKLGNETYVSNRDEVNLAAQGLKTARLRGNPLVLVLYTPGWDAKGQYDAVTKKLLNETMRHELVAKPLKSFEVVVLPLEKLAALTQLAELPTYELGNTSTSHIVITRPNGEQRATLDVGAKPEDLASQLWPLVGQRALDQAARLTKAGKQAEAQRLLEKVAADPLGDDMSQRVQLRLADMMFRNADEMAANGSRRGALKTYVRLRKDAPSEELRQKASELVAKLRS